MTEQREMKIKADKSEINQLIAKYAGETRDVYEKRSAGDYTFTGLFAEFVWELQEKGLLEPQSEER